MNRTENLSSLSIACVCVEIDLLISLPSRIWIGIASGKGFWKGVNYEDIPSYCSSSFRIGPFSQHCIRKTNENAVFTTSSTVMQPAVPTDVPTAPSVPTSGRKRVTWQLKSTQDNQVLLQQSNQVSNQKPLSLPAAIPSPAAASTSVTVPSKESNLVTNSPLQLASAITSKVSVLQPSMESIHTLDHPIVAIFPEISQ